MAKTLASAVTALINAVLEAHRDDIPPRIRELAERARACGSCGGSGNVLGYRCAKCAEPPLVVFEVRDEGGSTTHIVARRLDQWEESDGTVLWWKLPVCEPPYVGTPSDDDWPGYHTHWTEIVVPENDEVAHG